MTREVATAPFYPPAVIPREGPKRKYPPRKPKGLSEAQRWAYTRNWDKLRLNGMRGQLISLIDSPAVTPSERLLLTVVLKKIESLLHRWPSKNKLSKKTFLSRSPESGVRSPEVQRQKKVGG